MTVDLSPELEELIEKQVKSGHYSSASEVVQDALLLLEHRDVIGPRKLEIRNAVEEGWQSAQRGELVDGDEVFDRLDAELMNLEQPASK